MLHLGVLDEKREVGHDHGKEIDSHEGKWEKKNSLVKEPIKYESMTLIFKKKNWNQKNLLVITYNY